MTPAGFPHSDTPGSQLGCQLPRAYRRLLRPSSALDAKASTMCPSQLVTHTTNPTPPTTKTSHHPETTRQQPPTDGIRQAMHTTRHKRTSTHRNNHPACATKTIKHTETHQTTHPSRPSHNGSTHNGQAGASPDARVHYPDLKQQPHTTPHPTQGNRDGRVGGTEAPDASSV